MRRLLRVMLGFCLGLAGAGPVLAEPDAPLVVVELFTSQGCSSCPPADALLSDLAERDGVVPLALHVDYWDYIGWTDKFAQPAFTARQRAYARAINSRTIYTPQMIVGGSERVEGYRPMDVAELIQRHQAAASGVSLSLERSDDALRIAATAAHPFDRAATVALIRYRPEATVSILRGENAGRTLTYHNIVTSWKVLGTWDGRGALSLNARAEGGEPVVVIVQADGPGAILAAARLR